LPGTLSAYIFLTSSTDSFHDDSTSGSLSSPNSTNGGARTSNSGELAAFKAKLETQGTNHIVVNMQDHFFKQRKEKTIAREKQKEAVSILHSYHGEAELVGIFKRKDVEKLYTTEDQELYDIVDRSVAEASNKLSMIKWSPNTNEGGRTPSPTRLITIPRPDRQISIARRLSTPKVYISVIHDTQGILLLQRKDYDMHLMQENHMYELPGGFVEEYELTAAERVCGDNDRVCILTASKIAAARLLYQNVGIDVRRDLLRLQPTSLRNQSLMGRNKELNCEINGTLFFNLFVSDGDLIQIDDSNTVRQKQSG